METKKTKTNLTTWECKCLVFYGRTSDREDKIEIDTSKIKLDFALSKAFELLEEEGGFNAEETERIFWERITALANL